jgi:hypothetical protein
MFSSEAGSSQLQGVHGMRSWSVAFCNSSYQHKVDAFGGVGMSRDNRPGMRTDSQK